MKLECVLTSCNLNKLYSDFIPFFVRMWKKLLPDIKIIIVLIAEKIPEEYIEYKEYIILFKPLEGVSTAFTSQYIRNLYPCILKDIQGGIVITDMDIMPMNKNFYTEPIKNIQDDKFIHYYNKDVGYKEYLMCYNFGLSKTWSDIFKINSIEDVKERLISIFNSRPHKEGHGNTGWNIDQLDLYKFINEWDKFDTQFIKIDVNTINIKRLCRSQFRGLNKNILNLISKGFFTDYHALRPYSKYKVINEKIFDTL